MVGVRIKQCQQYSAHPSSPFVPLCHPLPNSNNALYSYSAGVYSPRVDATAYEDHAVTLVGYTDMWMNSTSSLPVWIIKNRHARWSWSGCTTWGRGGGGDTWAFQGPPGARGAGAASAPTNSSTPPAHSVALPRPVTLCLCCWDTSWGVNGYLYMLRTPWGTTAPKSQYWAGIYSAFYAIAA